MLPNKLEAISWGGPISNNISQAIDFISARVLNVSKHSFESINIRMNI
jgi:hypothetical protein